MMNCQRNDAAQSFITYNLSFIIGQRFERQTVGT